MSNLWRGLTQANPELATVDLQTKSRLLASILLISFFVGLALLVTVVVLIPRLLTRHTIQIAFAMVFLLPIVYVVNRAGKYRSAVVLLLAAIFSGTIAMNFLPHESASETLSLVLLPVLLATVFFNRRTVTVVTVTQLLIIIPLNFLLPDIEQPDYLYATLPVIFLDMVVVAFNIYRDRLEKIRQEQLEVRIDERTRQLDEARREIEMLYRIGKTINEKTDYEGIIQAFADELGAPDQFSVVVGIFDQFDLVSSRQVEMQARIAPGTTRVEPMDLTLPIPRGIHEAGALFIHTGLEGSESLTESQQAFLAAMDARGLMRVNISLGTRIVGAIYCFSQQPHAFSPYQQRILLNMADLAAGAVERMRLQQKTEEALVTARQANEMKTQFLASVSHELRTPLNAIINFTQFVSTGLHGPVNDSQVDALDKATGSARHLLTLINDVLDMSKIEAGRMQLFFEDGVDLYPEIEAAATTARTLIGDKPVELIVDTADDLPAICADRRRIRQVLLNLLSNAAKFTEQGAIKLCTWREEDRVLFAVEDTGPGIPAPQQKMVFEPFRQLKHDNHNPAGTGLGLPISKKLVEAHGGTIQVSSTPGEGTTFTVSVPIDQVEGQQTEGICDGKL